MPMRCWRRRRRCEDHDPTAHRDASDAPSRWQGRHTPLPRVDLKAHTSPLRRPPRQGVRCPSPIWACVFSHTLVRVRPPQRQRGFPPGDLGLGRNRPGNGQDEACPAGSGGVRTRLRGQSMTSAHPSPIGSLGGLTWIVARPGGWNAHATGSQGRRARDGVGVSARRAGALTAGDTLPSRPSPAGNRDVPRQSRLVASRDGDAPGDRKFDRLAPLHRGNGPCYAPPMMQDRAIPVSRPTPP